MEWKKGVRTDLAVEALELGEETDGAALPGMRHRAFERCGIPVTEVEILDNDAAQRLGKPIGHYLTLTLGELPGRTGDTFERTVQAVTETLMGLLPQGDSSPALVIGLGNQEHHPRRCRPHRYRSHLSHPPSHHPGAGVLRPVASCSGGAYRRGGQHRCGERRIDPSLGTGDQTSSGHRRGCPGRPFCCSAGQDHPDR